ncbi:MAG: hypothetical protein JO285_13930, partial [Kutzneria sp.]|nr:hypothetical protein [Kutzneria sp.]
MRPVHPADERAWCHGAPGIGLARAEILGYLDGADGDTAGIRLDLRRAADAMLGAITGGRFTGVGNRSLCHGDVGNLLCLDG